MVHIGFLPEQALIRNWFGEDNLLKFHVYLITNLVIILTTGMHTTCIKTALLEFCSIRKRNHVIYLGNYIALRKWYVVLGSAPLATHAHPTSSQYTYQGH